MKAQDGSGGRLTSIDALRGFDMFWIIGGDHLGQQVCKRLDSSSTGDGIFGWLARTIASAHDQFEHATWHGFHFEDLIFPLFLFLVGCVLPFSLGKYGAGPTPGAYGRVIRRTLSLIALGFVYSSFLQFKFLTVEGSSLHFNWSETRFPGVLQRIGLCYFFAALIVMNFRPVVQAGFVVAILVGYHALLAVGPGASGGDHYSVEGNLAARVDRAVFAGSKMYFGGENDFKNQGDNEGILSTLPAIATTLLGALAGALLRSATTPLVKVVILLACGAAAVEGGWLWESLGRFPVNKMLWSSSYVLVAGGWSLILLGAFYFVIDVCGLKLWAHFFTVIGANAITIYMLQRIVNFDLSSEFLFGGIAKLAGSSSGPLILAVGSLTLKWLVLWFLYRHRAFFRV